MPYARLPPHIKALLARQRRELEAAYGGGMDNGPTPQAEISGVAAPQAGALSASTPCVAPDVAEVNSNADTTFSVTDLVKVLNPITLESLMDSCGLEAPTWAKLRRMFPQVRGSSASSTLQASSSAISM
ncbi:hypothetical protein FBU31_001909 [Coemansia sp. 'formosensis']|nr:hypothetical protein FBU31_001909 [Coemansia sp. 'formosensis']